MVPTDPPVVEMVPALLHICTKTSSGGGRPSNPLPAWLAAVLHGIKTAPSLPFHSQYQTLWWRVWNEEEGTKTPLKISKFASTTYTTNQRVGKREPVRKRLGPFHFTSLKNHLKNPKLPKSGCWKSLFRCHVQIEGPMVFFLCLLWQLHIWPHLLYSNTWLLDQTGQQQAVWWVGKIQIWSSPYFPPNLIPSVKCTPNRSPSHVWRRAAWSSTFVHCYLHTFPWGQDVKFTPTPVFSNLTQFSF